MTKFVITAAVIALAGAAAGINAVSYNENSDIAGGWKETESTAITPEMNELLDKATESLIGVEYEAVELLETQLVNGTNYKFLAETQVVSSSAEKRMAIITIYKDPAGNVTVLEIENV